MTTRGFKELDKMLRELPMNVEKRVAQWAVVGALRDVRKDFVASAPKSEGDRSPSSKEYGTLKKNIKVSGKGGRGGKLKQAVIHTGDAFWALFYEKGTRYQPARPWFDPLFKSSEGKIIESLKRRIYDGIQKGWDK